MKRSWLEALSGSAGPLVGPARRFVAARMGCAPEDLPRGHEAMARLGRAMDAWCDLEDPGEEADRAFVEGAGALLGLLLIDHAGEGAHATRDGQHLVRLGPRGWFDPFAAIEGALDAEDPRGALAAKVREAEAEARGEGTVSRVLLALEGALARERPAARVAESFAQYVRLEPDVEIDLSRVIESTAVQGPEAVRQAVDKLVSMLPGGGGPEALAWETAAPRLLPRLISEAFLEELRRAQPDGGALWIEPLGHDARVALLVDHGDRARYLRRDEVEGWGRPAGEARSTAVANLASRSAAARFARVDTPQGPWVVARSGDGLDAARLLLPGLHDVLAPELGSPFLAAIPHRDTLIASAREPEALARALRARASDDAARAPHGITSALFEVSPGGLRPA